jgi:hypothetical protein
LYYRLYSPHLASIGSLAELYLVAEERRVLRTPLYSTLLHAARSGRFVEVYSPGVLGFTYVLYLYVYLQLAL